MAQLITGNGGYAATIGGTVRISGSNDVDVIYLADIAGKISFDGSFNRGGDFIVLPNAAKTYTVLRASASSVTLADSDSQITIPVGSKGTAIQFADGELVLKFDGQIMLGAQAVTATAAAITASLGGKTALPAATTASGALIMMPDEPVLVGGNVRILGTNGSDTVTVANMPGNVSFDGSFNRGGDKVILPLQVAETSARFSGSSAVLGGNGVQVTVPVGSAGALLQFKDDTRLLAYDTVAKRATIGEVSLAPSDTQLSKGGPQKFFSGTSGNDYIDVRQINLSKDVYPEVDPGAGDDQIITNGAIRVFSSSGNDKIVGQYQYSALNFYKSPGSVNVDMSKGFATDGFGGTEAFTGIEWIIGSNFDDTFVGGRLPTFFDTGGGNDIVVGGTGGDTVTYWGFSKDFDVKYEKLTDTFTVTDKLTSYGTDTLKGVTSVQFRDTTIWGRSPNLSWEEYNFFYSYTKDLIYKGLPTSINLSKTWYQTLMVNRTDLSTTVDRQVADVGLFSVSGYGSFLEQPDGSQIVFYSGWQNTPDNGVIFIAEYKNGVVTDFSFKKIDGATHPLVYNRSDGSQLVFFPGVDEGEFFSKTGKDGLAQSYVYDPKSKLLTKYPLLLASHNSNTYDLNSDGLIDIVAQDWGSFGQQKPVLLMNQGDGTFATQYLPLVFPNDQRAAGSMAIAPLEKQANGTFAFALFDGSDVYGFGPHQSVMLYYDTDYKAILKVDLLPPPYFEAPQYRSVVSIFGPESTEGRSHDVSTKSLDIDGDGDLDLVIAQQIWSESQPFNVLQILVQTADGWRDETEQRLFGFNMTNGAPGHRLDFFDVNGDGFLDIIACDLNYLMPDVDGDGVWNPNDFGPGRDGDPLIHRSLAQGSKVLINDGTGHFAVTLGYQISPKQSEGFPAFVTSLDEHGRLRFTSFRNGLNVSGVVDVVTRTLDYALSTGPNGSNPAERGAPGFNEFYYLLNNKDVQAGIENGSIKSGLEHYLAIGRAEGRTAFAPNAWVQGSAQNDTIVLREGNERGYGGDGNDTIDGKAGNDRLYGGAGNDVLSGGSGKDTFVFDTALIKAGVDRITDFNPAEDKIELAASIFKGLSGSVSVGQLLSEAGAKEAKTADQRLIYDTTSGNLFYDEDGSGSAFNPIQIALLSGAPSLSSNSFVIG